MAETSIEALLKHFVRPIHKGSTSIIEKASSTTTTTTITTSHLSTFESIPVEIRHLIYACFLPPDHRRIDLTAEPEKSWLGPLLRTSRRLHKEVKEWLTLPSQYRYEKSDQWGLIDPPQTTFTLVIDKEFRQLSAREFDSRRARLGHMFAACVNICDRAVRAVVRARRKEQPVQLRRRCEFEHNRIHRRENDRCKWYWLEPRHDGQIRHLEVTFATQDDVAVWRRSAAGSARQQSEAWMSANGLLDNSIAAVYLVNPGALSCLESVDVFLGASDLWGAKIKSVWSSDIMNQPYWAKGKTIIPITAEIEGTNFWIYSLVEFEERQRAPARPSYKLWVANRNGAAPCLIHHWPADTDT